MTRGHMRAVTGDEFAQQLLVDQPDGIDAVIGALVVTPPHFR